MSTGAAGLISALGLSPGSKKERSEVEFSIQIAYVDPNYTTGSGRPKLRFSGESTVGTRQYPYLDSYTPNANDKVIVVLFSHSGCILGSIV